MPTNCAIYLRVSDPSKQTIKNQRGECAALARARRYKVVEVYEEGISAAAVRPVFQRMMNDARRHKFDVLIIWALDRFGRSFVYNVLDVADLDRLGVRAVSVKESWLDTTSGMVRQILVGMFSAMAEHERERHKQRVQAGMKRAQKEGHHVGRPRRSPVLLFAARDDVARGVSERQAAKKRGVPISTLRDFLKRQKEEEKQKRIIHRHNRASGKAGKAGVLSTSRVKGVPKTRIHQHKQSPRSKTSNRVLISAGSLRGARRRQTKYQPKRKRRG